METQTPEVMNLSLEKIIETKLVQNNVTEQVLSALKEKYGNLRLKSVDDKESYLEVKQAARDCAKVRTLATKVCKEGREDAVKIQKGWIAEEKKVLARVAEVEGPLDAEIDRFDAEVQRKITEEKNRQEEAYINRQAALTKMGAVYSNGSFVLGEASFEANLIKESSQEVWEDAVIPKFTEEYEKIEAVKVEEQRKRAEAEAEMKRQQEEFRRQQEEFKLQQEEMNRQKAELERVEREKADAERREQQKKERELEFEAMKIKAAEEAEAKRLADIELAIKNEKERQEEEARQAIIRKQQEQERKQAELEAAGDKKKWEEFIKQVSSVGTFEMRSHQYRTKMKNAKEMLQSIINL